MKLKKHLALLSAAVMTVSAFGGDIPALALKVHAASTSPVLDLSVPTEQFSVVTPLAVQPYEAQTTVDGWQYTSSGTAVTITGYKGTETNLVIPKTIDDIPVTAIASNAFAKNTNITSVDLGSVQTLGDRLFEGCTGLKEITIPNTVTTAKTQYSTTGALYGSSIEKVTFEEGIKNIPAYMCNGASALKTVVMPEKPEGELTYIIGKAAFAQTGLKEFAIPKTVTSIGDSAFAETKLASVTLPDSITELGSKAFKGCGFLKSVTLNSGLTTMGDCVFEGSEQLKEITIPNTVTTAKTQYSTTGALYGSSIEKVTFEEGIKNIPAFMCNGASALKNVVIPEKPADELTYHIGEAAFAETALTELMLPKTVTSIGASAYAASKLTSVTLSDSITELGSKAFKGCAYLKSVTLNNGLKTMGDCVFEGSAQLTEITIPKTVTTAKTQYSTLGALYGSSIEKVTFEEGIKNIPAFMCNGASALKNVAIPEKPADELTFNIGEAAFAETALTELMLPKSVTSIGTSAYAASKLTSVTLPDSVTEIGSKVFKDCAYLQSVTLNNGLRTMGDCVFENSAQLTEITIPKTVTTAKTQYSTLGALYGSSIQKVTFEEGIKNIPAYMCNGATALKVVVIPEKPADELTFDIGEAAFAQTALTEIAIPNSVTSISSSAFAESKLASVTLPDSVTEIGSKVFRDCNYLKAVSLGNGLKIMGDCVFENSAQLKEITIPKTVTVAKTRYSSTGALYGSCIEKVTFEDGIQNIPTFMCNGASALTTVVLPEKPADELTFTIGECAFSGTALKEVTVPASVNTIGEQAFGNCSKLTAIKIYNPKCVITDSDRTICTGQLDFAYIFNGTIYGYAGSTAEEYAKKYNYKFAELSAQVTTTVTTTATTITTTSTTVTSALPTTTTTAPTTTVTTITTPAPTTTIATTTTPAPTTTIATTTTPAPTTTIATTTTPAPTTTIATTTTPAPTTTIATTTTPAPTTTIATTTTPAPTTTIATTTTKETVTTVITTVSTTTTLVSTTSTAPIVESDDVWEYTTNDIEVTITGYKGVKSNLVVPRTIGGKPVTAIASNAFAKNAKITSIDLGNVKTLGDRLFEGCTGLKEITIPKTVIVAKTQYSTTGALYGSSIEKVTFEEGILNIPEFMCNGASALTTVVIPEKPADELTYHIGKAAFAQTALTEFVIPKSVTSIGDSAYAETKLVSVTLPDSVKAIGSEVFRECLYLKSVTLNNGLTTMGSCIFENSVQLKEITIPKTVTTAKTQYSTTGALYGSSIEKVTFEEGILNIPEFMCNGASALTTVVMPEKPADELTYHIGKAAFAQTGLKEFAIPKTVTSIGDSAFAETKLASVTLPNSITELGSKAFKGCAYLKSVTLNNGLKTMGDCVFEKSEQLTEITIPKTVTTAKAQYSTLGALYGSSIEKVTFEEGIKNIPAYMCNGASALKTVVMPEKPEGELTYIIGEAAFAQTSLTEFVFPKSVTSIGASAYAASKLTSVTLPDSVTEIGSKVFKDCAYLQSVTLNNGLRTMGDCVFENSAQLTEITIPKTVTTAKTQYSTLGALYSSSIQKVTFEEGIKNIPAYMCNGATALTTVVIPEKPADELTYTIGKCAFSETALKEVSVPASVTAINEQAFGNCSKLTAIKIYNPKCVITDSDRTICTGQLDSAYIFNGTIYGYAGSTAEDYAKKYNYKFAELSAQPETPELETGDLDGNSEVSTEDAQIALLAYVNIMAGNDVGLTAAQLHAADVNHDGQVSVDDAQLILLYYVTNTLAGNNVSWEDLLKPQ